MAILTLADTSYFSGVTLTGNDLLSAIRSAQALAESPKGANRPLEVQQYVEKHDVGATRTFFVGKTPILTPAIRIRSRGYPSWGRELPPGDWFVLQDGQYEIDQQTGEITVYVNSTGMSYSSASSAYRDWSGVPGAPPEEVEITYSSGYVFTGNNLTHDALTIKQAVSDILRAMQSQAYSQGISRYSQARIYDVEFSGVPPAIDNALQLLQKYQPRV